MIAILECRYPEAVIWSRTSSLVTASGTWSKYLEQAVLQSSGEQRKDGRDALPVKTVRQYLPPKPGYVPVYIQEGDTPPDVASIYEGPVEDEADTDALSDDSQDLDDSSLRALRQSEEFIIQQLTDSVKDNEVRGVVEVVPK